MFTEKMEILKYILLSPLHSNQTDRKIPVAYVKPCLPWGPFLETPETFQAYFGCHNFLRILKTKTFPGMKFYFKLHRKCEPGLPGADLSKIN